MCLNLRHLDMPVHEYGTAGAAVPSWHTSGTCHLGQYQRAIQDYDKAIQVDPDHVKAYTNRGNAYKNLGQKAKANADFGKACFLDKEYCD